MKRMIVLGAIALAAVLGGSVPSFAKQHGGTAVSPATQLRQDMRKLWTDHTTYTRAYVVSAVAALPDLPTTAEAGRSSNRSAAACNSASMVSTTSWPGTARCSSSSASIRPR